MTTYYHQYWHTVYPPSTTMALIGWLAGMVFYFLPGLIAKHRRHRNHMAIWALDFFLGWTFLGWVWAFVWALTDNVEGKR